MRRLGEELRDLREAYQAGQDKAHSSEEEVLGLHNQVRTTHTHTHTESTIKSSWCDPQVALLSVEMCSLREENERMKTMAEIREPSEQLQNAIRDRDEAIAKYGATRRFCRNNHRCRFHKGFHSAVLLAGRRRWRWSWPSVK